MAINQKPKKVENSYFSYFSMDSLFSVSFMPYLDIVVNIATGLVYLLSTLALSKLVTKSMLEFFVLRVLIELFSNPYVVPCQ